MGITTLTILYIHLAYWRISFREVLPFTKTTQKSIVPISVLSNYKSVLLQSDKRPACSRNLTKGSTCLAQLPVHQIPSQLILCLGINLWSVLCSKSEQMTTDGSCRYRSIILSFRATFTTAKGKVLINAHSG